MVGAFHGWTDKQVFTLENGQVWQIQDTRASLAGVDLMNPKVTFNRSVISGWYMKVEGYNSRAKAVRIKYRCAKTPPRRIAASVRGQFPAAGRAGDSGSASGRERGGRS